MKFEGDVEGIEIMGRIVCPWCKGKKGQAYEDGSGRDRWQSCSCVDKGNAAGGGYKTAWIKLVDVGKAGDNATE